MEIWYTLTGEISPNTVNQCIAWLNSQIYSSQVGKIKFIISSTGGDIDSAVRLHDYLKALPQEVETVGFGQVDSAAITIFLAGRDRIAVKNCRFTVHEGTYNFGLPSAPLHLHEETLSLFKEMAERGMEIIAETTGKSKAVIRNIVKEGKPLSVDKAKELGIVTRIVDKLPLQSQSSS